MGARNPARSLITIAMNLLVVLAVACTARLVVLFFGQLSSQWFSEALVALTNFAAFPLGVEGIKTPYGGVFDVEAAATVVLLLLAEWTLSVVRSRV